MELKCIAFLLVLVQTFALGSAAKNVHYIHWNRNNPMFRIDNTDHIVDVNRGNLPWEYDQVNLICPVSQPGDRYPERHVIYSVSKEEYDACRITNPKPRIVAICNQPHRLMYFTITFRSFTPTPGGLEFHPGHDYYFISTSSRDDLHRRVGGGCSTHNMRMIFKVHDNTDDKSVSVEDTNDISDSDVEDLFEDDLGLPPRVVKTTTTTTMRPAPSVYRGRQSSRSRGGDYVYYYHPRDLVELENSLSDRRRSLNDEDEDAWSDRGALRYTSDGDRSGAERNTSSLLCLLTLLLFWR